VRAFGAAFGAKYPKAAAKITDSAEELLAFSDYPCASPCSAASIVRWKVG
jgi:mannose/fructose-specific phosphotransferase system component IIA